MRHKLCVPAVDRIVACRGCQLELIGPVVRHQRTPLATEGTGAPSQCCGDITLYLEGILAAVAASLNRHVLSPVFADVKNLRQDQPAYIQCCRRE